ncbi:MAG: hypothetical protein MUC54_06755, partial [Chloroflexi bacterium]|nr:hypothetical protein [Chloroflexota bacterium]
LGEGRQPAPRLLTRQPGEADEAELVSVRGTVADLARMGDRWRAEIRTAHATIVVAGLAGAAIPATLIPEGAEVTVVGVVRRPHPSALDRRFAVAPRGVADVESTVPAGSADPTAAPAGDGGPGGSGRPSTGAGPVATDLAGLDALVGSQVRVSGVVVALDRDRVLVDDGTTTGRIRLVGEAAALLPLLEPGDAVGAVGQAVMAAGAVVVEVARPADVVRLGDLGEALAIEVPASGGPPALTAASSTAVQHGSMGATTGGPALGAAALVVGLAITLAGGSAALAVRRRRQRRRLAARIAERLDALAEPAPPGPSGGSRPTPPGELLGSVREPA